MGFMMKRMFTTLPVCVVLADLAYNVAVNIKDALQPSAAPLPKDGLPVSPEFAFGWIQVLVNGGMVLAVALALVKLLLLSRAADQGRRVRLGISGMWALLVAAAFALPALWNWFWALVSLLQGRVVVSFDSWRYLVVACCQPFVLLLCVSVWRRYRRLPVRPPVSAAVSVPASVAVDDTAAGMPPAVPPSAAPETERREPY